MNLNRKVNSILGLLLIIISLLGLGGYLLFQSQEMSVAGNHLNLENIYMQKKEVVKVEVEEEEILNNTGLPNHCLEDSYIFIPTDKVDDEESILFRVNEDQSLDGELSCLSMVQSRNILRWKNKLIYTYVEKTDSSCDGICELTRKILSYDLETEEEEILLGQDATYGKEDVHPGPIFRFDVIENNLYFSFYQSCIGCSYSTNRGANYRLNLNDYQDIEMLKYSGNLIEYKNSYYHYVTNSDIGGSGLSQLYKYDLDKDGIMKDYNIEEKLENIILEFNNSKKTGENFYSSIDFLGFMEDKIIIQINFVNWADDSENDEEFIYALDLQTAEMDRLYDELDLDLKLLTRYDKYFSELNSYSLIKNYLEGFEDKYHFISY